MFALTGLVIIGFMSVVLFSEDDNGSFLGTSQKRLSETQNGAGAGTAGGNSETVSALLSNSTVSEPQGSGGRSNTSPKPEINYKASQVIVRQGSNDFRNTLPTGTNMVGKLLTAIDTREPEQLIKVLLPFGGKYKGNDDHIEKNTILFGRVNYPGQGNKVYLRIQGGVSPEGREFKIEGQALNSKDFSPGLFCNHHSNAGSRMATSLALTGLSVAADVLAKKETVGNSQEASAKPTFENAFLLGASKVAQVEAERKGQGIIDEPEYATCGAGQDLIITLTNTFKGDLR